MSILKSVFLGLTMILSFQVSLQAQTYATPELKQKAEAEQAANEEKTAPVTYAAPVDVTRPDLYKLASVDAVDVNNKHTPQEMTVFQAEAEGEFQKINLLLDWGNQRWYVIPRDNQLEPAEKKFRVEGNLLQFMDCRDCQDNTITIAEHTDETLILQLQPQDEGRFFVYVLTFKK